MWASLFGGSAAPASSTPTEGQSDAGQQISNFFSGIGTNVNSFLVAVTNPDVCFAFVFFSAALLTAHQETNDKSEAAEVGKSIGNWFSGTFYWVWVC